MKRAENLKILCFLYLCSLYIDAAHSPPVSSSSKTFFERSFPSRSFASLEDDTMGRAQRAKTSPRRISGGRKCKRITLKPVGNVRPCNKLPAVQGHIGHRRTLFKRVILSGARRYCKKKRHSSTNQCEVEPFFDRDRRKKAREWLAHEPRDLQKGYM